MDKVFVLFKFIDNELQILTNSGESGDTLPREYKHEATPLSSRQGLQAYYAVVKDYHCENFNFKSILEIDHFEPFVGAVVCEALGELWPLFKKSEYDLPKIFVKDSYTLEEGTFYGGSFNPWHEGHDECLKRSLSQNIIIVPDRNPWKENQEQKCFFKSLKEILLRFENTPYSVFPGFYGKESSNPTVSWIGKTLIKKRGLLMGDDNFCQIFKWQNSQDLLAMLSKIEVLNRNHTLEEVTKIESEILKNHSTISIDLLGDHPHMDLSSTRLRNSNK